MTQKTSISSPATSPQKLLAISDIHGRYDALRELALEKMLCNGYRVVFLGDYVGYGHQSAEVLQYIICLQNQYPQQVIPLCGNWEDMLYQALFSKMPELRDRFIKVLYKKGFGNEFKRFKKMPELSSIVRCFPSMLRMFYLDGTYCFAHAGVNVAAVQSGHRIKDVVTSSRIEDLLWNLDFVSQMRGISSPYTFVVGHVPVQRLSSEKAIKPFVKGNIIGIDLGASRKTGFMGYIKFDKNGVRTFHKVPSLR